jgi:hypothetical protein
MIYLKWLFIKCLNNKILLKATKNYKSGNQNIEAKRRIAQVRKAIRALHSIRQNKHAAATRKFRFMEHPLLVYYQTDRRRDKLKRKGKIITCY